MNVRGWIPKLQILIRLHSRLHQRPPENHTGFNTFNNDSKAARISAGLPADPREIGSNTQSVFNKGLCENG